MVPGYGQGNLTIWVIRIQLIGKNFWVKLPGLSLTRSDILTGSDIVITGPELPEMILPINMIVLIRCWN